MDPTTFLLLQTIAALVVIGGAFLAFVKWGRGLPRRIWNWLIRDRSRAPRDTMRVVPCQPRGMWWHMGSSGNEAAMQVVSRWHVTNITNDQLLILGARIVRPRTDGHVYVEHPESRIFGSYPILPGDTSEVSADFWIQPPVKKKGQVFKARIVLIDQYGNELKTGNVVFEYS